MKVLNRRQARWSDYLSLFNFKIIYHPGRENGKADALSHRVDLRPEGGSEHEHHAIQFLKPGQYVNTGEYIATLSEAVRELLVLDTERLAMLKVSHLEKGFVKRVVNAGSDDPEWSRIKDALERGETFHEYSLEDGMVCYRRRIWIPDDNSLRLLVAGASHDTKVAGHFGKHKTLDLIRRDFHWPSLDKWIAKYVKECDHCQRNKTVRHREYGLLQPLEIPYAPWSSISMDFIVQLPTVCGYNQVWTVVDRFTKMVHFILLKSITARELADGFVKEIWHHHDLLLDIVSDRDPKFTSNFWKTVMKKLNVHLNMSTAFHPQTDGQSEALNQVLEQYLRIFCTYHQDDWVELLPFAEFSYNNSVNTSTKMTPFYAVYGQHPRSVWPSIQEKCVAGNEFVDRLETLREELRENLSIARERMRKFHDKKKEPQPDFQVGDKVLLNAKNIKTLRPSKKLDHRMRGPWTIIKRVGPRAFKLDMKEYKGQKHDVFPVGLLERYHESTIPGRVEPPPPPVGDEEDEFDMEEVLDSRLFNREVKYLVRWKGYGPDDVTWEPWKNMVSDYAKDQVREFHRRYPEKPRAPGCKL